MTSHVLYLFLQLSCRPLLSPLEDHMLEEMSGPVGVVGLEPRPGVDPHPDGGGAGGEARLGGDAEAVGERGDAGLGGGEDAGVVGDGRVRGGVPEEPLIRVLQLPDLRLHGLGEVVVDHGVGGRRGGGDGGGGRCGSGGGAGEEEGGGGGGPGAGAAGAAGESEQLLDGHGSRSGLSLRERRDGGWG